MANALDVEIEHDMLYSIVSRPMNLMILEINVCELVPRTTND